MRFLALFLASLMLVWGLMGGLFPRRVMSLARYFDSTVGWLFAVASRALLAFVLGYGAAESQFPELLWVLSGLIGVVAVVFLLMGPGRFRELLHRVLRLSPGWARLMCAMAAAIGALLIISLERIPAIS